jgi:hypothetical protein
MYLMVQPGDFVSPFVSASTKGLRMRVPWMVEASGGRSREMKAHIVCYMKYLSKLRNDSRSSAADILPKETFRGSSTLPISLRISRPIVFVLGRPVATPPSMPCPGCTCGGNSQNVPGPPPEFFGHQERAISQLAVGIGT